MRALTTPSPGDRFGRLTVIERSEDHVSKSGKRYAMYLCRCDCGKEKSIDKVNLVSGKTMSCGCLRNERVTDAISTHGDANSRLYNVWCAMKRRCYNKSTKEFSLYGGRGIDVCDEWRNSYEAFRDWALQNGYRYDAARGECTLDRIDCNGGYRPDNCRWVDTRTQMNNVRYNHYETYNGETHTISEWGRILNIDPQKIRNRMRYGWSFKRAVETDYDARSSH